MGDSDKLIENIKSIIDLHIKQIKDISLPIIRKDIKYMIKNNITEPEQIEPILDCLLDYTSCGLGEEEFLKLNDYYVKYHSRFAKEYLNMLNESKKII